jgi:uncharacterized UBP type Zn finger protein
MIQSLMALLTGFHKYKQGDAHEFLMFILGEMQKSCLPGPQGFESSGSEHNTNLLAI